MKCICITLFLYLFRLFLSECIPNKNCLKSNGKCINNICECYKGFWSLNTKEGPNIYCDYKRKSRFMPLILELFGIGIGHFTIGNYKRGFLKLFLILTPIISTMISYRSYKNEKTNEKSNNESKNEEELNLINNENKNNNNQDDKNNNNNNNNNNNKDFSFFSDEGYDSGNISFKLHQANHHNKPIPASTYCLIFIVIIFLIGYIAMYIADIIGYGFAIYKDGNNVPLL
jgi:hypothetical protein